jgi:hypothetical protein
MKTCLNRLIGKCENGCKRDYDTNHHPNNYDCVNYQESVVMEFKVRENEKPRNYFKKFILETFKSNSCKGELLRKLM